MKQFALSSSTAFAPAGQTGSESGFSSGTPVLTQAGDIPVDQLSPGDRLISRDAGFVTLEGVLSFRCITRTILFTAGSLGLTRKDQDLRLPAGQQILVRDWRARAMFGADQALVRADALIDGEFIRDLGLQALHLHQLRFSRAHVLYAGGMEVASAGPVSASLRPAA